MKFITTFLVTLLCCNLFGTAVAQDEKKALTILEAMSKKYQALNSFKAAFTYTADGEKAQNGEATVKGAKFRLKVAGQEIFNDGAIMATYIRESNEVNIQDFDPEEVGDFSPAKIYMAYKNGFKNAYIGETKEGGETFESVRMVPVKADGQVAKVEIKVNKADRSIKSWKIFHKNNKATTFVVNQFTPNAAVADTYFVFNAKNFPGVEVIDLR